MNGGEIDYGGAGSHLSGGERQRISIARAMLKNAPVVILDEATAYTDSENEALVQRSVANLVNGRTLIVIAHRLSTIASADNIVLINDESYIQQAISELCRDKTLLVIAHRLNTIVGADNIMVIKDGRIAGSGNHSSLMQKDGIYRSMVTKRAVSTGWNR